MIDIVSSMAGVRGEILSYVKTVLDDDSVRWLRELLSDMNKRAVKGDDEFASRVWPLYRNALRFFKEVCDDITPGGVLATFYISAMELGVRDVGDAVEVLPQFVEEIDMDDWDMMSTEYAIKFDLRTAALLTARWVGEDTDTIWAGGLHTLSLLSTI